MKNTTNKTKAAYVFDEHQRNRMSYLHLTHLINASTLFLTLYSFNKSAYYDNINDCYTNNINYKFDHCTLFLTAQIIYTLCFGLTSFLVLQQWSRTYRYFNRTIDPVAEELEQTKQTTDKHSEKKHSLHLKHTASYLIDPDQVVVDPYMAIHQISLQKENIKIIWSIKENVLLEQTNNLKNIFDQLNQLSHAQSAMPIYPFSTFSKYLPYITPALDMPSKFRVLNYFSIPAYFATQSLSVMLPFVKENAFAVYLTYSLILLATNVCESYILNDAQLTKRSKGFMNFYQAWESFLPTCVGMQFTEKLVFYPSSTYFNRMLNYIIHAEKTLEDLEKNQVLDKLSADDHSKTTINDIKKRITHFRHSVKKEIHSEKNLSVIQFSFFNNNSPAITPANETVKKKAKVLNA